MAWGALDPISPGCSCVMTKRPPSQQTLGAEASCPPQMPRDLSRYTNRKGPCRSHGRGMSGPVPLGTGSRNPSLHSGNRGGDFSLSALRLVNLNQDGSEAPPSTSKGLGERTALCGRCAGPPDDDVFWCQALHTLVFPEKTGLESHNPG